MSERGPADEEWLEELDGEVAAGAGGVLPRILGRGEVGELLGCPGCAPVEALAVRALYAGGLRGRELLALERTCLDGIQIRVGERLVVVDEETARRLGELAQDCGSRLFPWSEAGLRGLILRVASQVGLAERFSGCGRVVGPAMLRHSFATHRLENGMNLASLYSLLGHRSAKTTLMYVQTAVGARGADYCRCHPLMERQAAPSHWRGADWRDWPEGEDEGEDEEERGPKPGTPRLGEILAMMAAARRRRDYLIVRLFYATGVRLAELLTLLCLDFDPRERRLFVRQGKGGKDRYCLIDPHTMAALQAFKPSWPPSESLFGLNSATPVESMVRKLAIVTGIHEHYQARGETISPHSFRHAFATHCYLNGMAPACLKRLLGHERLETTQLYLDIPHSFADASYQAHHPLAAQGA